MTLTIEQAYELPRPEDIRAMGFVIKLKELAAGTPEVKKLVEDYVERTYAQVATAETARRAAHDDNVVA